MIPNRLRTFSKFILVLVFSFNFFLAHAQNPQAFNWANRAATLLNPQSYSGQGCAIASQVVDNSGNIYIVGDFSSSAEFYNSGQMTSGYNSSFVSQSDIYITKLGQNGIVMWKKKMGNAAISEGCKQILIYNNNLYILGRFKNVSVGGSSTPVNDGILQLDFNGNYVGFIPTVDLNGSNVTLGGFAIHNNIVYLYGTFTSTQDFDVSAGVANLSTTGTSSFIQKITLTGTHISVKKLGGTTDLYLYNLKVINNDMFAVGRFRGTANFNPNGSTLLSSNAYAGFILNLDTAYNYQWCKVIDNINYSNYCYIRSMALDKLGDKLYIVGDIDGEFNFDAGNTNLILGTPPSTTKKFVVKYNTSNGNMIWGRTYKTSGVSPNFITVADNSDVYITGSFTGAPDFDLNTGVNQLLTNGNSDAFINKIDSSANHIWTKQMGGAGADNGLMISIDPLGNMIASGSFNQAGDFNPDPSGVYTLNGAGQSGFAGTFTVKTGNASTCSTTYGTINGSICQGGSYMFNGVNRTTAGVYKDTLVNVAGCDSMLTLNLSVANTATASVTIVSDLGNSICSGNMVTFSATPVNGGSAPLYQWKRNGTNVATGDTYTVSALANGNTITCVLTSNAACVTSSVVTSNTITMVVNTSLTPSVSITSNSGTVICAGQPVTFSATATNSGSAPTYQWMNNGVNVGAGVTYTTTGLSNSDVISCLLTTTVACATSTTALSNSITMTVNPSLIPSVSIISNSGTSVCAGSPVTFSASPVNGGSTPTYQWKNNGTNVTTGATYTVSTLTSSDVISCILTSNASCASPTTASSNSITMTVNPLITPSVSITSDLGTAICAGSLVTFSASAVNGGTTPLYQWKKNGTNMATGATYTVSGLSNSDVISCVLTSNASCANPLSASSNSITVTVNGTLTPAILISIPTTTICGSSAVFSSTITNGGSAPVYQWKKNGSNVGSNIATYSPTSLVNGDVVSCILTSNAACASPAAASSNSIIMTINTVLTPSVSITSDLGTTICAGSLVTFSANPVNGGSAPAYQWKKNGINAGAGATYTISTLANSDVVSCVLTSNSTCASPTTANSNSITLTVNSLPSITVNSGAICSGASFSITPNGASTYTVTGGSFNVSPTATSSYSLTGTSAQGCVSSNVAVSTVSVNALPTISVNSGAICSGASFSITPNGANTYTVTGGSFNVSPTATTSYSITGTSAQGCVSSNVAVSTVSVNVLPTISVNSGAICSGASFSISPNGANTYTITGGSFNVLPIATTSYSVTGTSAQGCVSSNVAVSTVSVNARPTISVNSGAICSGASFSVTPNGANTYTVTGGSFNVSPTTTTSYTVTGTSAQGCVSSNAAVSTVSVNALPTISVNSGAICSGASFSISPNGASTYTITGGSFNVSPTATTSYTVTGTSAQGCVSSNTVISTVTVNNTISPTISISTTSTSICSSSAAFTSTITNGGSTPAYQWKKNGVNVGSGLATYSPTSLLNGDVISCILTSNAGCASPASIVSNSITMTVNTALVISVNSGAICSGASFSITPNGASTYTITGGSFNVSPTATTSYSVTGTSTQGCVSSNVAVSTVSVNATPTITTNSGAICSGTSFSIIPNGANTYTITGGSFNVSPTATMSYSITGTSTQGCVSSNVAVSTVSVNATPTITTNSGAICSGASFSITPNGASTYTVTGGLFNVSPTATSSYTLTGTSAEGCVSSNVTVSTVSVNALPPVNASTSDNIICVGESVTLTANGAVSYVWNTGVTSTSITVSPSVTTTYTLTGTGSNGCSNTAIITQSVNLCTGIENLNAATAFIEVYPNPTNGTITLKLSSDARVIITNELGQQVFNESLSQHEHHIDLSHVATGMYIVTVVCKEQQQFFKLVKQ